MRVKCLAQEHNTMSPARARTRTVRSRVERTNHEATAPPTTRLERHGILAKKSKCDFMVPSIEFLGYGIDGEGRHPTDEKIAVISKAPSPKNVAELRSYLGLLNYYGHFRKA